MRKKDKKEVIELLHEKINEIDVDLYNDDTIINSHLIRKGMSKALEIISRIETED